MIEATFSADVSIDIASAAPWLGLEIGDNQRRAVYVRSPASDKAEFAYLVQSADSDDDGISVLASSLDNEGNWQNAVGNRASITAAGQLDSASAAVVLLPQHPGLSSQQQHRVDGTLLPGVVDERFTSRPASGDTYHFGETIEYALEFTVPVVVEGQKWLELEFDTFYTGDAGGPRKAYYVSGSGTNTLLFSYEVQLRDLDGSGVTVTGSTLEYVDEQALLSGFGGAGQIKVATAKTVVIDTLHGPFFRGQQDALDHKVFGGPIAEHIEIVSAPLPKTPEIPSKKVPGTITHTYGRGERIVVSVRFNHDVTARWDAAVLLRVGEPEGAGTSQDRQRTWRRATYLSGNDTDTLEFAYTVSAGDSDADGVDAFVPYGQPIESSEVSERNEPGLPVEYRPGPGDSYVSTGELPGHRIDGRWDVIAPWVSAVAITSDPGTDGKYIVGDQIRVKVTFTEPITYTAPTATTDDDGTTTTAAAPHVNLDIGGQTRTAALRPTDVTADNALTFSYTVASGDSDTDGISVGAAIGAEIKNVGSTITDKAGNIANPRFGGVPADSDHLVDGIGPSVTSVSISSDPGSDDTYENGDRIRVQVSFDATRVYVTGSPQIMLNIGGTEKAATSVDGDGGNWFFDYTVAVGDADTDGISIDANSLEFNGGTIKDADGNPAALTHSAVADDSSHKVSAPGGL